MEQDKKLAKEDKTIFMYIPRPASIILLLVIVAILGVALYHDFTTPRNYDFLNNMNPNVTLNISPEDMEVICNRLAESGCPCNTSTEDCEFLKVKNDTVA